MRISTLTLWVFAMCLPVLSHAQTCGTANLLADTPNSRFILNTDGTLLDKNTGLTWKRCLEGQNWTGITCSGSASSYTWQGALNIAENTTFANQSDWRLPNLKELLSIVELACNLPAINLTVFPKFPATVNKVWSSTPVTEQIGTSVGSSWLIDFEQGAANNDYRDVRHLMRVVRGK